MRKKHLRLNCDMGEGFGIYQAGFDEALMPFVDMANLACGFHAADPVTMHRTIRLAKQHGVEIGAHPSYPDLMGFGRRAMTCSVEEIVALVIYQCGALDALCRTYDTRVSYLKPHGALYHAMMTDGEVFRAILKAIHKYDPRIKLMILSGSQNEHYQAIADRYGVSLLYEAFADRVYDDDGSLLSRTNAKAVLTDESEVIRRAQMLDTQGVIETISGARLPLTVDALCIHGDNPSAVTIARGLHKALRD
jgi:5-oxoprolinase (ATP-hydrolysing) subunit A